MTVTVAQTAAAFEVLNAILSATAPKGRRQLAGMFLELVDRASWPQYYEVIPEPRCLNNIKSRMEKGGYRDATDIYSDISLVFWNALFYNEPGSQIALDAQNLKTILETEWNKRHILPVSRTSPPPSSAQKVHKTEAPTGSSSTPISSTSIPVAMLSTAQTRSAGQTAGTSTNHITPQNRSSHLSADVDVDVVSEDDSGNGGAHKSETETEELARRLESSLPKWPGHGGKGWAEETNLDRIPEILHGIKSHKDVIGNRLATILEAIPEESTISYLSFSSTLSWKTIESRARSKSYRNWQEFDFDMMRFFEKARRWLRPSSESYGRVLLLQRLYQLLSSPHPVSGPPYHTNTNFAALRAGPGNVNRNGESGDITTHQIPTANRTLIEQAYYKGWTIKIGDWVHLSNPDDTSRPIIAQVFKCWVSDESSNNGRSGLTVSWYYRPEQTFHLSNRTFLESEVFKTGHYVDHPLEDVLEKIACQFSDQYSLGRPRPPFWYPGFPLYVCESRYNDRERTFSKIKNWSSCMPEEVQLTHGSMPIYPFERPIHPKRLPSLFIDRSIKGPGGIIMFDPAQHQGLDNLEDILLNGGKNTRSRKNGVDADFKGYAPTPLADRSVLTISGAPALNIPTEKLPRETAKHFDRDPETNEVLWFPAPPVDIARPTKAKYSLAYLHFLATKRKRDSAEPDSEDMNVDVSDNVKRGHLKIPPTATETLISVLKDAKFA